MKPSMTLAKETPEILLLIFSHVGQYTLAHTVRFVCKQWYVLSRPLIDVKAVWNDTANRTLLHRPLLRRLHKVAILHLCFEVDNSRAAEWVELTDKMKVLRATNQLQVRKLVLFEMYATQDVVYPLLSVLGNTLTDIRVQAISQRDVHLEVILALCPKLQHFYISDECCANVCVSRNSSPPQQGTEFFLEHCKELALVSLVSKDLCVELSMLEAVIRKSPRLRVLKIEQSRLADSRGMSTFLRTIAKLSIPYLEDFHYSDGITRVLDRDVTFITEYIPARQQSDQRFVGPMHRLHICPLRQSSSNLEALSQPVPGSRKALSLASHNINERTSPALSLYINTLTRLEIVHTSSRLLDDGLNSSSLADEFLSNMLHQYLCESPHLQHLIAPKIPYYAEYIDYDGDVDEEGFYSPRDCGILGCRSSLRMKKQVWACRGLQTLRLLFTSASREGDDCRPENAQIMFTYIVRFPELRDLMIQRAQLCLALEGGMWMLASLNKLERLAIGTETWTKSELMDWDWMARYPDATYGDECAEKTECWPRLEFLGLDFVDVVHRKPYPLEKRFAKVIAQIRPGVELSFDSGTW